MKCPACGGDGCVWLNNNPGHIWHRLKCYWCDGTGKVEPRERPPYLNDTDDDGDHRPAKCIEEHGA